MSQARDPNYDAFLSLKIVFILLNSADPDQMHFVAFHIGFHVQVQKVLLHVRRGPYLTLFFVCFL